MSTDELTWFEQLSPVGLFLSVLPERGADSIPGLMQLLSDRLPPKMVPIAADPGGDVVLMDFRGPNPEIFYWHHERCGFPDEYTYVAENFSEFLSQHYEPDIEEESKLD